MITLQTSQVQEFLRYAAAVKPNILYPALDCIKIEGDGTKITYTKTNNNVFCVASYPSDQSFSATLVNERSLAGLLMVAEEPEVTLEGQVLKCGQRKVNIPVQEAGLYPNTPEPDTTQTELPDATLAPIRIAARYYSRTPLVTVMSFIHADQRGVFATNGQMTYHYKAPAPQLLLDEEVANVVGGLKGVKYSTAGNYDWYTNDAVSYAFIRKECPVFKYDATLDNLKGEAKFSVALDDLKKFCALVEYTSKQENPLATMSSQGNNLDLVHEDHDFGSGVTDNINMEANAEVEPFKFNVKTLNNLLSSLPYAQLTFTLCNKHYKLTSPEDANYTGILSVLQN